MKFRTTITAALLISVLALLLCPFVGMVTIDPVSIWEGTEKEGAYIFWQLRVPRVLLAYLVGGSLALGGMVFQAMFRNLLATPFTLGVSSGAALGAALSVKFGAAAATMLGLAGTVSAAFSGALLTIMLVYALATLARSGATVALLLAGIIISFFFSSIILFIQYLSDFTEVFKITRWLMGNLETVGFERVILLAPFAAAGFLLAAALSRELNLMAAGDDIALARGVHVRRVRFALYFGMSLLVGAVVALTGIISFVGIVVPYICRLLTGHHHGRLTPITFLCGGAFLVICDTLARTLIAPSEIPVGVITALLGGPFFLWLLIFRARAWTLE